MRIVCSSVILFWFLVNYLSLLANGFHDSSDTLNFAGPLKEKKIKYVKTLILHCICLHNLIYLKYGVLDLTNFRTKRYHNKK